MINHRLSAIETPSHSSNQDIHLLSIVAIPSDKGTEQERTFGFVLPRVFQCGMYCCPDHYQDPYPCGSECGCLGYCPDFSCSRNDYT